MMVMMVIMIMMIMESYGNDYDDNDISFPSHDKPTLKL